MARICEAAAPRATQAIWIREIVAAIGVCGVSTGPVSGREGDTIAEGQNRSELPALGNPLSRAGPRFRRGQFPRCIENKTAAHVVIRETARQFRVEIIQTGDRI